MYARGACVLRQSGVGVFKSAWLTGARGAFDIGRLGDGPLDYSRELFPVDEERNIIRVRESFERPLAQIYEAKGDRAAEAAQLREYLKYASDPNDVAMVKQYLSELEKPAK